MSIWKFIDRIIFFFKKKEECLFWVGDTVCLCNNTGVKGLLGKALLEESRYTGWKPFYVLNSSKFIYLTAPENMCYLKSTRMVLTEKVNKLKYISSEIFTNERRHKYIAKPGAFSEIFKELVWTEENY